jgi:hypothetical protein
MKPRFGRSAGGLIMPNNLVEEVLTAEYIVEE